MSDSLGDLYVSFELSDYYDSDTQYDIETFKEEDHYDVSLSFGGELGGIHMDMTADRARQLAQGLEQAVREVDGDDE